MQGIARLLGVRRTLGEKLTRHFHVTVGADSITRIMADRVRRSAGSPPETWGCIGSGKDDGAPDRIAPLRTPAYKLVLLRITWRNSHGFH